MITTVDVRAVIVYGEIIEDYPADPRGHSCLLFAYVAGGRPVHVVCAPKQDYLAVITAYIPSREEWEHNFKKRIKI